MRKKSMFDRNAEKILAKSTIKTTQKDEDSKKKEDDAKDKDDKSKTEDDASDKGDSKDDKSKDDSKDKDKQPDNEDSDSKKDDAKDGDAKDGKVKDGKDDSKSEPDQKPATPQPAPASRSYTGAGDISGVKDLRQDVVINGDVSIRQYGGAPLVAPPVGDKLNAFVESISKINFTNDEENGFRDGSILYEVKRAKEEGEVPGAAVKFADLVYLKCPEKLAKLVRNHISEIIESDPEVIKYIKEVDARKHQIERRFKPFRAELSHELWDEATTRPYITEQKADLPPRLAENARDEDFGTWILVEVNGDTGAIRELSAEEVAKHDVKATPEPKKDRKPRKKPDGDQSGKGTD